MEEGLSRPAAIVAALAASFQIYLMLVLGPLFGIPEWPVWPAREVLFGNQDWLAVYSVTVLVLQGGFSWLVYMVLRRPEVWRAALFGVSVPIIALATPWLFLGKLPVHLLVEPDGREELRAWPVACALDGVELRTWVNNAGLRFERAGRAWVGRRDDNGEFVGDALLSMPGCQLRDRAPGLLPAERWTASYASTGAMFVRKWSWRSPGRDKFWYLAPDADEPVTLEAPEGERFWQPVLSSDGVALAWFQHTEGDGRRVHIRDLATGSERTLDFELPSTCGGSDLVSYDRWAGELLVFQGSRDVAALDLDGNVVWGPVFFGLGLGYSPEFRRLGDGWVAWNRGDGAYRELGSIKPARIEWSFASARGHYEALGGRSITSVSVDPSGTYIALGTGARIAGSGVRGAVHVLEAVGGAEVYRRYLAPGSGGEVAFLGRDYLAVGTATGGSDQIEVLRVGANPADS